MVAIKRGIKKKTPIRTVRASSIQVKSPEKVLVQNFVALQRVMVNLSTKFEDLSSQIAKLLNLFEISAKTLAEKGVEIPENKEILQKLDNLSEQNKVVARGVTLMHQAYLQGPPTSPQPISQLPSQQVPQNLPTTQQNTNMQGYQRSIASKKRE